MRRKTVHEIHCHLSLCFWQVALCAQNGVDYAGVVDVILSLRVPFCETRQRVLAVQTANQDDDIGPVVVLSSEGLVALSTPSIH